MGVDVQGMLRLAFGSMKDHASVGKAMIYNHHDGFSEIEIAVVRATGHDKSPIDDKYMHEILFLVSNSPDAIAFLAERISRRLAKTRDRLVALKTLLLIHRLLRGGNRHFEQQLRGTYTSGHLQLHPQWLSGNSDPSFCFLQSYAAYLEERMGWMINQGGKLVPITSQAKNFRCYEEKSMDMIFHSLPKYQEFIDKVLELSPFNILCWDSLTQAVMRNILKESFQVYMKFCECTTALINMFFDLTCSAKALACDILKKASWQSERLHDLYENCKRILCNKNLEYPTVEVITMNHVIATEQCLSCMPTKCKFSTMEKKVTTISPLSNYDGEEKNDENKSENNLSSNLFSCTLETKISMVWVVFEDENIISV